MKPFEVGQRIIFFGEKMPYKVRAFNDQFAICTRPYNFKRTVFYTIIDLKRGVRGTENLIFCMGFKTVEQCKEAIERLSNSETEVSYRNFVRLIIDKQY